MCVYFHRSLISLNILFLRVIHAVVPVCFSFNCCVVFYCISILMFIYSFPTDRPQSCFQFGQLSRKLPSLLTQVFCELFSFLTGACLVTFEALQTFPQSLYCSQMKRSDCSSMAPTFGVKSF